MAHLAPEEHRWAPWSDAHVVVILYDYLDYNAACGRLIFFRRCAIWSVRNRSGNRLRILLGNSLSDAWQNFSLALQLQPQCFGGLTLISWGQTLYYHK